MKRTLISIVLTCCFSVSLSQEWKQISWMGSHAAGLKQDGTLWAWGGSWFGVPGSLEQPSSYSCPVQIEGNDWAYVGKGGRHTLAIKTDGSLWAWGDNGSGRYINDNIATPSTPVRIGNAYDWKTVTGGPSHSVAIKQDGTLWTWGESLNGDLGLGSYNYAATPTLVDAAGNNWKTVSAGFGHTFALKEDGSLWAWGLNDKGQLGDQTYENKQIPTRIGTDNDWKDVAVNSGSTVALKNDGSIWVWGDNSYYQLGDNTPTTVNVPKKFGSDKDWIGIASGGSLVSAALKKDGTIWVWGYFVNDPFKVPTRITEDTDWSHLASATHYLKKDGSLWAIGDNNYRTVGDGSHYARRIPVPISTHNCQILGVSGEMHTFKIYPNPVKDVLYVEGIDEGSISSIELVDVMGKSQSVSFNHGQIDLSLFTSGLYYIMIHMRNEAPKVLKWVKE